MNQANADIFVILSLSSPNSLDKIIRSYLTGARSLGFYTQALYR